MKIITLTLFIILLIPSAKAQRVKDTTEVVLLITDTVTKQIAYMYGYDVKEKHNTAEGVMDAEAAYCTDNYGQRISCYSDYWVHVSYLNQDKKPHGDIIIWQSVNRKIKKP